MEENIVTIRSEYMKVLRSAEGKAFGSGASDLELYKDICCGCVLIAEDNLRAQRRSWENSELTKVLLRYAAWLECFDPMLPFLSEALSRMTDTLFEHPRLSLKLLQMYLTVLRRIEAQQQHDLSAAEHATQKIDRLQRNISLADKGLLDEIRSDGHLKDDPVEWTLQYENVIDDVERELDLLLYDHPRGMGFCHALWYYKEQVLQMYGIGWRSPHMMNPGVMFD